MVTLGRKRISWTFIVVMMAGLLAMPVGMIMAHGVHVQPPKYLASEIEKANYFNYAPRGSDSGVQLDVTDSGMWVLSNGTLTQQQWWADLFADWIMGQPQWPDDSDRTRSGLAKEIHCHANRSFLSDKSMNLEYNWGDVEFFERLGCWMWSP